MASGLAPFFQRTHDLTTEAVYNPRAGVGDELNLPRLPWLEAHGSARCDVEVHATRGGTVEAQGGVHFAEMVVGADLHGSVAGVLHAQHQGAASRVDLDRLVGKQLLTGFHGVFLS